MGLSDPHFLFMVAWIGLEDAAIELRVSNFGTFSSSTGWMSYDTAKVFSHRRNGKRTAARRLEWRFANKNWTTLPHSLSNYQLMIRCWLHVLASSNHQLQFNYPNRGELLLFALTCLTKGRFVRFLNSLIGILIDAGSRTSVGNSRPFPRSFSFNFSGHSTPLTRPPMLLKPNRCKLMARPIWLRIDLFASEVDN